MTAYKELSTYMNDDQTRSATIRKELATKQYVVSVMNESGHAFSATFETEENAEAFAEDWVLRA